MIAETADSPLANARAFSGHGELAFVSRDQLWVLDGSAGKLRHLRVPAGYTALTPMFSHDGRWLAYMVKPTDPNYRGTSALWIAHVPTACGARRVAGVRLDQLVGWSPRADVLAVTAGQQLKQPPIGSPTVARPGSAHWARAARSCVPGQRRHSPSAVDAIGGAVWSPNGAALAVALQGGRAIDDRDGPAQWTRKADRVVRERRATGAGSEDAGAGPDRGDPSAGGMVVTVGDRLLGHRLRRRRQP